MRYLLLMTNTANAAYTISAATRSHLSSQNLRPAENPEHERFLKSHGIPGRWTLSIEGDLLWVYYPGP